jgi:uncharacterized protein (TIGR02147 family)
MANVFEHEDYRAYLRAQIAENSQIKAYRGRMALAAGCQRSFFSQVLNSHVEFTLDHAAGLCEFFSFTKTEGEYFLNLVQMSRASTEKLRILLRARLNELRDANEHLGTRLKVPKLAESQHEMLYFSSWYWTAVHVCADSPKYQTAEALAKRLLLPEEHVRSALKILADLGLVEKQGQRWRMGKKFLHVNSESIMTEVNHLNWRQRALLDIQAKRATSTHYTSVFSMSKKDYQILRTRLLSTIDDFRKFIAQSPSEELYAFTCDLFEV